MTTFRNILAFSLLSVFAVSSAVASVAVVVNVDNANELTERQIRNIFLGKMKTFPDGSEVGAFELASGVAERDEFNRKILRKSESNLNAYWARMIFSSKGKPPEEMASAADVIQAVAKDKGAIGYVNADDVNDSVRVIYLIK